MKYSKCWADYYEEALSHGHDILQAAAIADAAMRSDLADAIEASEGDR